MKGNPADPTAGAPAGMDPRDPLVQAKHLSIVFNCARDMMLFAEVEPGVVIRIVSVNRPYVETIRLALIGRTSRELSFWVNPENRDRMLEELRLQGSVRKMEVSFRAKDGHILITLCNGDLIEVAGKPCILSTFEDITEQRRIESQKAQLEAQLRQSQKLEALGTLAGGIAHDFNNILSAMIVYRELAVMDIDRPEELRSHLAEIGLASNRAKDLVRQILTFSRQQQQERRAVQLHPVVREALQLLRASLPATIEIIPVIDEQAPQVLADTSQVHQIMMNLATNAAHAMRNQPGGLKVTLGRRRVDEAHAQLHPGLRAGAYVRLSIADTGCGMDENIVARIFEPFFTTKGPGEGTGLGLSEVHGIMEDHDGAITVNSRPGEGTNFDLYFPEYVGAAAAIVERESDIPRGSGESVLVVDDETALCEAMRTSGQPSRALADEMLKQTLAETPDIIGVWTVGEQNAFDGRDADYAGKPGHDASLPIPGCSRFWVASNRAWRLRPRVFPTL